MVYVVSDDFVVPKEIAHRGKAAIAKFVADLRKGKAKMPRCKLMILGEAGVGKTSLLSLLTGEKFNPDHHETEGVDTDFVRTSNKKAMEGDEEYKDVAAKQLAQILPDKEQPVKHKKKRADVPSHTAIKQQYESLVKKYTKQKEPSAPPKDLPPQNIPFNQPLHPHLPPMTMTAAAPTSTVVPKPPTVPTPLIPALKFSSFDFAGQKHYKPMHHCFLTSRAVYVVAFNVRHLLNDQRDKCIQELKFWINSIHIYTDVTAKIVLVGTHRGPYPGIHGSNRLDQLTSEQEETIYEVMKGNFDRECYASRISWFENKGIDDEIIAMVENSLRGDDSGANAIRDKLLELGNQYPGNNDDLPTSYLHLEQKIFEERKQNTLIPCKEVIWWARNFGIDDPAAALTFFHDIGTIIDPSESLSTLVNHFHIIVPLQVNCPQYLWTKKSCQC